MHTALMVLAGIALGVIVVTDPFLSILLSRTGAELYGTDLFRLYPYQWTSLVLLILAGAAWAWARYGKYLMDRRERVLLLLILISPQVEALSIGFIDPAFPLILVFLPLWLVGAMSEKRFVLNTPIHLMVILFLAVGFLSSVNGRLTSIFTMLRLFKSILYFFIVVLVVRDRDDLVWAFKTLFIVTGVSASIAVAQEAMFLATGIPFVGNVSKDAIQLMFEPTPIGTMLRAPAFFGLQSHFAKTLALLIPMVLMCLVHPGLSGYFERRRYILCLAVMMAGLALTFSKPAWISVALGVAIVLVLRWPSFLIHFTSAAVLAVIIASYTGIAGEFLQAFYNETHMGGDFYDRLALAKETLMRLGRHPLIGAGLEGAPRYTVNVYRWPVHNGFILSFVTTGIIGLVLFCAVFVHIYLRLVNMVLERKDALFGAIGLVIIPGVTAYILVIQFVPEFIGPIYLIYILALSAAVIHLYSRARPGLTA